METTEAKTASLAKTDEAKASAPAPTIPKLRISAEHARVAASCMAVHDIRYYLNGLLVEPNPAGGVVIVGTDGHRLCAVLDKDGTVSEPTIIHITPDLLRRLPKPDALPKKRNGVLEMPTHLAVDDFRGKPVLVLENEAGAPLFMQGDVLIEGKFPDWRRVVLGRPWDELKLGVQALYQPHYLHDTLALFKGKRWARGCTPYQFDQNSVILWHIHGADHVLLGVMPMRTDEAAPTKGWTKNFPSIAKKAKPAAEPETVNKDA